MNRVTYSLLFYLATPLLFLRLLWRSLRSPAYLKRWAERFALYGSGRPGKADVVFHAVSVGEVHAAVPLIDLLLATNPALGILVTTMTPTGSARVGAMLGDRVQHVYLPYDYPGAASRFLDRVTPALLVIMETELWPNLINGCARRGIKVVLANARLSEKSLASYRRFAGLARSMLQQLHQVSVQSVMDGERLQALGLPADRITLAGSMKYDLVPDAGQAARAHKDRAAVGDRPVWIAVSTRSADGVAEEAQVLAAFRQVLNNLPGTLLVLVPRHPERFDAVFGLASGLGFTVARRSREGLPAPGHQVWLGDSMGEMQYYLGLADVAFVGGSLVPTGCQNIIEPAAMGLPVISGPSLYNFQAASDVLREAGGMRVVKDETELAQCVTDLLVDESKRAAMGRAALAAVNANQGATDRNLALVSGLLAQAR